MERHRFLEGQIVNHFKFLFVALSGAILFLSCSVHPAYAHEVPSLSARTPEEEVRQNRLKAIWKDRAKPMVAGQPSVAEQIVPFLSDPFYGLRVRAGGTGGFSCQKAT